MLTDNHFKDLYIQPKIYKEEETALVDVKAIIAKKQISIFLGVPGAGKTTFCEFLMAKYANNGLYDLIPIILNSQEISNKSLEEAINNKLKRYFEEKHINKLKQADRLLIIFDAYDELPKNNLTEINKQFCELATNNYRFVITGRDCIRNRIAEIDGNSIYIIEKFDTTQINNYLYAYSKKINADGIDELLKAIYSRKRVHNISGTPFFLGIIAHLYFIEGELPPDTMGKLFKKAIGKIFKERFCEVDSSFKKVAVPMFSHSSEQKISEKVLLNDIVEGDAKLFELITSSKNGLLIPKYEENGEKYYKFIHQILIEYFVACSITEQKLINFLHKDKEKWIQVAKMYCNLTTNDNTDFILRISKIDLTYALDCIAESSLYNNELKLSLIEKNINLLDKINQSLEENKSRVIEDFGLLISDNSEIGEYIFSKMKNAFEETPSNTILIKILVASQSIEAIKILVINYDKNEQIIKELKEGGDIVIDYLVSIAEENIVEALYCLHKINNDVAKQALQRFIWNNENDITTKIASYLIACLLPDKMTERILDRKLCLFNENKEVIPNKTIKPKQTISWVWEPFSDESTEVLTKIANRAAFVLFHCSIKEIKDFSKGIPTSRRIAIPLSIFKNKENKTLLFVNDEIQKAYHELTKDQPNINVGDWKAIKNKKKSKSKYIFKGSSEFLLIHYSSQFLLVIAFLVFFQFSHLERFYSVLASFTLISLAYLFLNYIYQVKLGTDSNKLFTHILTILSSIYLFFYMNLITYLSKNSFPHFLLVINLYIIGITFIWGINKEKFAKNSLIDVLRK